MSQGHQLREHRQNESKDTQYSPIVEMIGRVASTTVIWFMATGMLAVSSDMLRRYPGSTFPYLILGGAVLSTAVAWGIQEGAAGCQRAPSGAGVGGDSATIAGS